MVVAGVLGAVVLPPLVARTRAARTLFHAAVVVTLVTCVAMAFSDSVPVIGIGLACTGFLLLPCLPVILEISERHAGPAGVSAAALVWLCGQGGGIFLAIVVQIVVHRPEVAFLFLAALALSVLAIIPRSDADDLSQELGAPLPEEASV